MALVPAQRGPWPQPGAAGAAAEAFYPRRRPEPSPGRAVASIAAICCRRALGRPPQTPLVPQAAEQGQGEALCLAGMEVQLSAQLYPAAAQADVTHQQLPLLGLQLRQALTQPGQVGAAEIRAAGWLGCGGRGSPAGCGRSVRTAIVV